MLDNGCNWAGFLGMNPLPLIYFDRYQKGNNGLAVCQFIPVI